MTYLEQLLAARAAILDRIINQSGYQSYSLDGESWSAKPITELTTLEDLILREQNRVSGRRDLRLVRGRRYAGWR